MPGSRNSDSGDWLTRMGWAAGVAAAAGAYVARERLRTSAATVARMAADTLESSTDLVERSVREAGRIALLPADATLALARDRVLAGLPEAADTKWRTAQLLLRSVVVSEVARGAAAGVPLHEAGAVYARASVPSEAWDGTVLRETLRRVTHALDMEGTSTRSGPLVTVTTTGCPLVEGAAPEHRSGVCEAVCGEQASLLAGIAVAAGAQFQSPRRMGAGDADCLRQYTLPTAGAAAPNGATETPMEDGG